VVEKYELTKSGREFLETYEDFDYTNPTCYAVSFVAEEEELGKDVFIGEASANKTSFEEAVRKGFLLKRNVGAPINFSISKGEKDTGAHYPTRREIEVAKDSFGFITAHEIGHALMGHEEDIESELRYEIEATLWAIAKRSSFDMEDRDHILGEISKGQVAEYPSSLIDKELVRSFRGVRNYFKSRGSNKDSILHRVWSFLQSKGWLSSINWSKL